jgi:predicted DNA-binding WGR domain protein
LIIQEGFHVKRYFEFIGADASRVSGQAEKFWEITVTDSEIRVRFGKVGANGQTTVKTLPDGPSAIREAERLVVEKLKKGYSEIRGDSDNESVIRAETKASVSKKKGQHLDENGILDVESLSSDEILKVRDEIQDFVNNRFQDWEKRYGPFEFLSADDMGRDALEKRLDGISDNLIWADANYWDGSSETPIEGLEVGVNGYARLPGRSHYASASEADDFYIATVAWEGDPYQFAPVYTFMQFVCVFCEGSGERDDDECPGCDGEGSMEFES